MKKVIGVMLFIGVIVAILPGAVGAAPPAAEQTYTVQKDDNLWNLSEKYLGNGALYRAIVYTTNVASLTDATVARIWNPALIQPGQKLVIPDADTAAALLAPPAPGELGSADRPVQVYFVPSVEVESIVTGGEVLRQALEQATNLKFEVFVPTSYAAAIEGMCAASEDAMGFPATLAYVIANARCGVDASMIANRNGYTEYASMFLVPRASEYQTLEELNGLKWIYNDVGSTSGYLFPTLTMALAGIEPSEAVATGGHENSILSLYNGEGDFATSYFNPPIPREGVDLPRWEYGDDPEPFADIVDECVSEQDEGGRYHVYCGDYEVKDACNRAGVVEVVGADAVIKLRILALSDTAPNDCMAFGPDFPPALRVRIEQAITDLMGTEAWDQSLGDFYNYTALEPVTDARYDVVRDGLEAAGITMDDLIGYLD